jgi:2,4-dienoyl-CoA reductase-like NADH-dependent reductase (Old Yellow Enzyme family)
MTLEDIARVQDDFVAAARRAAAAGFEWLELHFAHGYLARAFLGPATSATTPMAAASNRARFLLETVAKVREVWPEHLPLTARFGVIEYDGCEKKPWRNPSPSRARCASAAWTCSRQRQLRRFPM